MGKAMRIEVKQSKFLKKEKRLLTSNQEVNTSIS